MSCPSSVYIENLINPVWRLSMDLREIETLNIGKEKIAKISLVDIVRFSRCFFPSKYNNLACANQSSSDVGNFLKYKALICNTCESSFYEENTVTL